MKIVYSCYAHNYTSMGVIANNVIRELDHAGFEVQYKVLNTDQNPLDYSIEVQKAMSQQFDPQECTEILFSYPDSFPVHMNCKIKVGYTGADTDGGYNTANPRNPWRDICNETCHYMLTPSQYSANNMKKLGVMIPIDIFPHGINLDVFKLKKRERKTPLNFVYTGELTRRKGTQLAIQSFIDTLAKNNPAFNFYLRANTHMQYLESEEIKQLASQSNNIFVEWKNEGQDDIASYMEKGDIYLYPSGADWYGMTVFEALAAGMPVIATATNGYWEFLYDKIYPLTYTLQNIGNQHPYLLGKWAIPDQRSLQEAILYTVNNYEQISEKSYENAIEVRKEFSWKNMVEKYLIPFLDKINTKHFKPETKGMLNKQVNKKIPKLLDRIKKK